MTILEAIKTYHRIACSICQSYFDISAANYTRFEAVRILIELKWTVVNDVVLCPNCNADWQEELKQN